MRYNPFLELFRIVYPNQCCACKQRLYDNEKYLCSGCLSSMLMEAEKGNKRLIVTKVLKDMPNIEDYNTLFLYDKENNFSDVNQRIKYNNQPKLGKMLGAFAAKEFSRWFANCQVDALLPVPLHRKREKQRGYNQSMKIAEGISEVTHIPILNDVFERIVNNKTQTHKNFAERQENVKGIFQLTQPERLKGKRIMLIDDVMTTGATISECVKILKSSDKGIKIFVFTLSKAQELI